MKRLLTIFIALLIAAALVCPALAEIYTLGSSGDEILTIQKRLLELAYVKRTPTALMAKGQPQPLLFSGATTICW